MKWFKSHTEIFIISHSPAGEQWAGLKTTQSVWDERQEATGRTVLLAQPLPSSPSPPAFFFSWMAFYCYGGFVSLEHSWKNWRSWIGFQTSGPVNGDDVGQRFLLTSPNESLIFTEIQPDSWLCQDWVSVWVGINPKPGKWFDFKRSAGMTWVRSVCLSAPAGGRQAQRVSRSGGDLLGVLCLGFTHHSDADCK